MNETEKKILEIIDKNNQKAEIAIRVLLKFLTPAQLEDFFKNLKAF